MRTIGRHVPQRFADSAEWNCDQCGIRYYTGQLVQMDNGLLYCAGSGTLDCACERTLPGGAIDDANQIASAMENVNASPGVAKVRGGL